MKTTQQQELIDEMLNQVYCKENDFVTIDKDGDVHFPVLRNGVVIYTETNLTQSTKGYRGLALEVNDHGNVTVWNCFKNGNRKEVASRV